MPIKVDFPLPLGPTSAIRLPAAIWRWLMLIENNLSGYVNSAPLIVIMVSTRNSSPFGCQWRRRWL
jgi:hypothetical protein